MFKQLFKRKRKELPDDLELLMVSGYIMHREAAGLAPGEPWPDYRLPENRNFVYPEEVEARLAEDVKANPHHGGLHIHKPGWLSGDTNG